MVGSRQYDNLPDSDSLSLPNFLDAGLYANLRGSTACAEGSTFVRPTYNNSESTPKQLVLDLLVFDMTKDLLATNINAEEEVIVIEPSTVGCGMEASGKQVQVADSENCAIQISAAIAEHDGEEDDELLKGD